MKISESRMPYSLGLEQVSGPLDPREEHFVLEDDGVRAGWDSAV